MTTHRHVSEDDSDANALADDEISDLAAKTRLAAQQANTTLNDAFRTIAAHEHPDKEFTFAYAPARHGHAFHAYIDANSFTAKKPGYTTKNTTFHDLYDWDDNTGPQYRNAINQDTVTTSLRVDADKDYKTSFAHVTRHKS